MPRNNLKLDYSHCVTETVIYWTGVFPTLVAVGPDRLEGANPMNISGIRWASIARS